MNNKNENSTYYSHTDDKENDKRNVQHFATYMRNKANGLLKYADIILSHVLYTTRAFIPKRYYYIYGYTYLHIGQLMFIIWD